MNGSRADVCSEAASELAPTSIIRFEKTVDAWKLDRNRRTALLGIDETSRHRKKGPAGARIAVRRIEWLAEVAAIAEHPSR